MNAIDSLPADDEAAAARALEGLATPVVRIDDGSVSYANRAARDALSVSTGSGTDSTLVVELLDATAETTIGTVRHIDDIPVDGVVRIHRDERGASITITDTPDGTAPPTDAEIKGRAIDETPVGVAITDPHREDNPIVYVNDAFERTTGYETAAILGRNCRFLQGPSTDETAVSRMREAIEGEEPVRVELENYRADGTRFWNEVTIAPVYDDAGDLTHFVGFQNDVTDRTEAQLAAERHRAELEYVLERVEGLVQDVTGAVAGASSRSALEMAVCERIAAEPAYDGAWISERDAVTGSIAHRTSAGVEPTSATAADHPAVQALETGDPASSTIDGEMVAAVPLQYNEIDYGVLVVTAATDREVDDRETAILGALANAVASGINARESSLLLATDAVVAVELSLTDPTFAPTVLARETGGRVEYHQRTHRTGDDKTSLYTVSGATADGVTAAKDHFGDDLTVLVDREDGALFELRSDHGPVGWFSQRGVRTESIVVEDGTATLVVEIPRSANVSGIVDAFETQYEGVSVGSVTHRESTARTRQEFVASLDESFTDQQFNALQRAYLGGYFDWPRPVTGEDLAQSMGVTRPTFHEHLRGAEKKLCRAFFGDRPAE